MKPMALIASSLIFLVSNGVAQAQGARGFVGGGGPGAGGGVQSGIVGGVPAPGGPMITPRPGFANPRVIVPGAPGQFHRGGGIFVPPISGARVQPFILGVAPRHLHNPWFFHHHSGIAIIDVPFFDAPFVTQYAPGIAEPERRFAEDSPSDARTRAPGQLAPFDPTPHEVVERMLALAKLKKDDVVYDLGSGDGRIVIAAAKKYGVHAVGFEIDPGLAKLARENVRRAGVNKLVEIRQQDFLTANLSPASVVTLYLSYDGNLAVRPQLLRQLKRDARVVSYTFDMGDWQPKIAETFRDSEGNSHQLYLWQIGEPMVFSDAGPEILRPQPNRSGPLIIDVR